MKVGIITFHNGSNYGAALQAFALQEKVSDLYDEVYLINYKNRFIMQGLDRIRWGFSLHNIYFSLIDILNYKNNRKKIECFNKFFEDHYKLTALLSADELQAQNWNWDLIISGSDQIWNPLLNNGLDKIYFGEFAGVNNKISYASSLGAYRFDNGQWNQELTTYLKTFKKISVRENAKILEQKTGLHIEEVLDPTLLLSKREWKEHLKLNVIDQKYLLVYAMNNFDNILAYAKKLAEQMQLELWVIGNSLKKSKNVKWINDIGPTEFVELFYNASYIVTNSFHGTAFSVNFGKSFSSIYNEKSPERVVRLLNTVQLGNYLVRDYKIINENKITQEELENAQRILQKERLVSIHYLEDGE